MTSLLVDFVLARVAEDEAAARNALALDGSGTRYPIGHPLDPARALGECAAKRRLVQEAQDQVSEYFSTFILETLATVYADHPECRDEWRLNE